MNHWQDYLNTISEEKKSKILEVLNYAKRLLPGSINVIVYGVPALKFKGKNIIAMAVYKNHLGIYPFGSNVINKIKLDKEVLSYSTGTLRFSLTALPSKKFISKLIKLKLAELNEGVV